MTPFGERLKEARQEREISAREFSRRVGIHHCQLSHYENGRRYPDFVNLISIAKALDCSLDWLVGLSEA